MSKRYDDIIEKIKEVDTDGIKNWKVDKTPLMKIVEHQKVYIWIRLYLKEECENILPGDIINITYLPNGEKLDTIFVCYGKNDMGKNYEEQVVNYNPDDNKKILCLMIDQERINKDEDIPFIRTLFKLGIHYGYQLVKRDELIYTNIRTGEKLDYYDCDY